MPVRALRHGQVVPVCALFEGGQNPINARKGIKTDDKENQRRNYETRQNPINARKGIKTPLLCGYHVTIAGSGPVRILSMPVRALRRTIVHASRSPGTRLASESYQCP